MYLTILAIILIIAGLINGYLILVKYPKEFQSTKVVHSVLTVFLLLVGIFTLIASL